VASFLLTGPHGASARLSQSADLEFARYIATVEARLATQHSGPDTFLATRDIGISGGMQVSPVNGGTRGLGGALLHHWRAAALVPHATPQDMLALLRDYDHFSRFYAPQVVSSRALTNDGEHAMLAMRLKEQKVITVVVDAEYLVESRLAGDDRGYSLSRSTHIWQLDNPGSVHERRRREGDDDGFLWRLNSYWSFAREGDGLRIECEAVSLTRDVPLGLGWLLTPMIQELPRETLEFTLKATRHALQEIHR
jgi:hypothetical protein